MYHYVYRLTLLNTFDDRMYYVGKHSGKLDDFHAGKYKSSSKIIRCIFDIKSFTVKIVKICKSAEEAIAFEGKYHKKLNVQKHIRFFNQQNQTLSGKLDRTGRITITNKTTLERLTISIDEYDKSKYVSINKGLVVCKNDDGVILLVAKETFDNDDTLVGVNDSVVHCIDAKTQEKKTVSKKEFSENKEKYIHIFSNKISAYDTTTGKKCSIYKEIFETDERYVGIKAFTKERKEQCKICNRMIGASNITRHIATHNHRLIWITDNNNKNSRKVSEYDFYLNLKDDHYIIPKDKDNTFGFIDGAQHNIRYIGRAWKN